MTEHFIITRFNLRKSDWKRDKSRLEVLDDCWLEERIELFLDFCLPSVVNQSLRKFKWLVFFEKDSQPNLGRLLGYIDRWAFIEPVFLEGYEDFQLHLPQIIMERRDWNTEEIITTRLDNDDALHREFIKNTQEVLSIAEPDSVLHFPYGYCLQQGKKNKLALLHYPLNQFLSLLEKVDKDVSHKFGNQNNFNKKIDELNQETEILIDEIEKWQT